VTLSETLFHELALQGSAIGVHVLCPELIATSIHRADHNHPARSAGRAPASSPVGDLTRRALEEGMESGAPPSAMAERVVRGISDGRFYLLAEDAGHDSCHRRLDDLRTARNPTFAPPRPSRREA
jgi:short-subunit dehydrogenase